jgi:outer membrane autotransporter protein
VKKNKQVHLGGARHFAAAAALTTALPAAAGISVQGYLVNFPLPVGVLTVIDTNTNTAGDPQIYDGAFPQGVAITPDGRYVYTSDAGTSTLTVFDASTHAVIGSVTGVTAPSGMAASPDGRFIYVADSSSNRVSVVNVATRQIVGASVPVGDTPTGLAVSPDGKFLYVSNIGDSSVTVINAGVRTVIATVNVGDSPLNLAVSPDGKFVYVANSNSSSVSVIDARTNTVAATIAAGDTPLGVAVAPDGKTLYVTNEADSTISVIDTATRTVVRTIATCGCSAINVSITPDGRYAYVTGINGVDVVDTATGTIVQTIAVGGANNLLGTFLGPNVIVSTGGAVPVSGDAALSAMGFGDFVIFNGGTLRSTGNLVTGRTISLLSQGGVFDTNGFSVLLSGNVQGVGSLSKTGVGTLTLNGVNTYTGGTFVNGGTLLVGDAAHPAASVPGAVAVNNGGTLGGYGTVGGIVANSGGTVSPGNSIGTLNVAGNVSFTPGSTYLVEIDPSGAGDRITAAGTASLAGTVNVQKAPGSYLPGTRYTVLTAGGGVSGTFDTLTQNLPFLDLALNYDANDVYLDVARNEMAFPAAGRTRNQIATAQAIEALGLGNALYNAVVGQQTDADARKAFDMASGETHASIKTALIEDSGFLRDAALDRLRGAFSTYDAGPPVIAYASNGHTPWAPANTADKAFWTRAFGAWTHVDGDGNAAAFSHNTGGAFFGTDTRVAEHWRVGALAGYSYTTFDANSRSSSGHSDNIHLGLYGGGQWGALGLRTGLGYSWHDIDVRRSTAFAGYDDNLKTDYNGGTAQIFAELGYRAQVGPVTLEPYANVAYVNLHTDGFSESGGPSALHGAGDDTDTPFTTLGLHASSGFDLGGVRATARGTLGWRHAYGTVTPTSNVAFDTGSAFTVAGVPIARDSAVVEAGLDFRIKPNLTVGLAYAGQFGKRTQMNSAQANVAWKF